MTNCGSRESLHHRSKRICHSLSLSTRIDSVARRLQWQAFWRARSARPPSMSGSVASSTRSAGVRHSGKGHDLVCQSRDTTSMKSLDSQAPIQTHFTRRQICATVLTARMNSASFKLLHPIRRTHTASPDLLRRPSQETAVLFRVVPVLARSPLLARAIAGRFTLPWTKIWPSPAASSACLNLSALSAAAVRVSTTF